jgi:hypothetical protein
MPTAGPTRQARHPTLLVASRVRCPPTPCGSPRVRAELARRRGAARCAWRRGLVRRYAAGWPVRQPVRRGPAEARGASRGDVVPGWDGGAAARARGAHVDVGLRPRWNVANDARHAVRAQSAHAPVDPRLPAGGRGESAPRRDGSTPARTLTEAVAALLRELPPAHRHLRRQVPVDADVRGEVARMRGRRGKQAWRGPTA